MGYDIYITRRQHWADDGPPEITRDEWKAILMEDRQMAFVGGKEDVAMMVAVSGRNRGAAYYFYHVDGEVFVKKPNREVLLKMLEIAKRLGAKVMGEGDEIYDEKGISDRPSRYVIED